MPAALYDFRGVIPGDELVRASLPQHPLHMLHGLLNERPQPHPARVQSPSNPNDQTTILLFMANLICPCLRRGLVDISDYLSNRFALQRT